jgi:transposase-like protein
LPHAKVAQALARQFNLELTPPTVLSITNRVADAVQHKYDSLRKQLLKEPYVHIDETSLRVAGRTYWVWVFCTNKLTVYVIQPTRGARVVQEILHDYKGIVVTDGYKVYQGIGKAQQRCWAHLLREAEWLASEHDTAKPVFEQLRTMYHEVKTLCKRKINRQQVYNSFSLRMNQLIDLCSAHREMRKFATTLRNGINAWFTAILHKGLPLTNNLAERQLREVVVQRKIFGTLRTERGTTTMQTLMSLIMTWTQKGKNALQELTKTLTTA